MPYIELKTDKKITSELEAELIREFGSAIEIFPGKTEKYLMVSIEDECKMAFAGEIGSCALVSVDLLGSATAQVYEKMTKHVCELVSKALGIEEDRVYVKYSEYKTWGWNGINF